MNNYEYVYTASYIIHNLATLLIVIASIILVTKKRTLSTILILIGSVLIFILGIGTIFIGALAGQYDTDMFLKLNAISNIASGLAYLMFCLGLLLFVFIDFKKAVPKNEFLD